MRLILIALMAVGSTLNAEEYFCPVSQKLNSDSSYSAAELQQRMPSVKIKQTGEAAIISRCSFSSSAGAVTCDDYKADLVVEDRHVGHKKYYHFNSQFDVQVFDDLSFIENNGRGDVAFGRCGLVKQ